MMFSLSRLSWKHGPSAEKQGYVFKQKKVYYAWLNKWRHV